MIDVGVGQDHVGQDFGIDQHGPVLLNRFRPAALEHAAIEKDIVRIRGNQMHGTGHLPNSAVKCNMHIYSPKFLSAQQIPVYPHLFAYGIF